MSDWTGQIVIEVALGVAVGTVLAWWAIRTLERWSYQIHATPCWPMTSFEVEHLDLWESGEALKDCRYPAPVGWARKRRRKEWRRHCEFLKGLGWNTEEILGLPEQSSDDLSPRGPKGK
jgi:hypothetical protein